LINIKFDDGAYYTKVVWFEKGFFYTRFPIINESTKHQDISKGCKVYYHKLNGLQKDDELIYESSDPKITYGLDGNFELETLYIYPNFGNGYNSILIKDLKLNKWFEVVKDSYENENLIVNEDSNYFYMHTNKESSMKRLVKIDKVDLTNWEDVISEKEYLLEDVIYCFELGYVLCYLENASTKLKVLNLNFENEYEIELPTFGTAHSLSYDKTTKELYYGFTSFTYPSEIHKYSFDSNSSSLFEKSKVEFDSNNYEAKQVWFESKDKTQIPMFIVHKKSIKLDSNNPTLLYGYGGFNISLTPHFSIRNLIFLEQGGIYVMVNLRGGGEFGENWHKQGVKEKKQNVFDDFIYAAKYLIHNDYTNSDKLAILGGSNGGLLVAACALQEPKLFKAALCIVGVLDMLRFHKFTNGADWIGDYGCSDNEEDFNYLIKYSP
jgi:prolyl oligopeptidase